MADNLLDKASILLTPTAYNDGKMLSVKPNENLYGSELVTNGDFATDSDWNKQSGWSISGGTANTDGTPSSEIRQNNVTIVGKQYKYSFTISNSGSGVFNARLRNKSTGTPILNFSSEGTYSGTFTSNGTFIDFVTLSNNTASFSIDNVSVVEDLSGDFTFSRSSAATRVNAQGLVENVQILSPELVSNGNFSQIGTEEVSNGNFSQEGSELVTNGDFATDSDWNKDVNWSIADGIATSTGSGRMFQYISFLESNVGTTVKVSFDITDNSNGGVVVNCYGGISQLFTGVGTHTFTTTTTNTTNLYFNNAGAGGNFVGSIDNVSVKEVGQDWENQFGGEWIIDGTKATLGTGLDGSYLRQTNVTTVGKRYKAIITTSGGLDNNNLVKLYGQSNYNQDITSDGEHIKYFTANDTYFRFFGIANDRPISIDSISVKEVGQDWTFGTGWSVDQANSRAEAIDAPFGSQLIDGTTLVASKKYKISFDISNYIQGSVRVAVGNVFSSDVSADGSYTFILTSANTNAFKVQSRAGGSGTTLSVTNVSVKEITDDTDLPRINYEGFSYQDALGSELITNGSFDTDSNWSKGSGWTISGGKANSDGLQTTNSSIYQTNVVEVGKTYLVTYTTTITSGQARAKAGFSGNGTFRTQSGIYQEYIVAVTNATFYLEGNSDFVGSIDNLSVKEVLGQEVVPDSGCGSWLLEPQSTNMVTYSEDFSQWINNANTTFEGGYLAPDGTLGATKVSGTIGTSSAYIGNSSTSTQTRTIWARTVSGTGTAKLTSYYQNTNNLFTLTEQWQRFEVNGTTSGVGGTNFYVDFRDNSQTLNEFIVWGAQSENLTYATSYIPTNGATNTRLRDIATNSGNSTLINSTEGVLYAEIAALADDGTSRIISLSDGTDTNRINLFYFSQSNDLAVNYRVSGSTVVSFIANLTDVTNFSKVAFKWKSGDFKMYVDGTLIGTNANTTMLPSSTLDVLSFTRGDVSFNFYGKNKALAVYKEALTDTNLRSLTYPNPVATTFDLDFDTIAEQFTFTRGSEATFVNAQGLIESTASNDAPRIDYSTGAKAFLLEPQSTNIITQSEDFSQWIDDTDTSITSNAIISPDGTQNADKLIAGNSVARQAIKFNLSASGNIVMSVFAKKGEYSVLQFSDAINGAYFVNFDIENGTIGASNTIVGSIQDYGNGWYRCVGVYNSANPILSFRISIAENSTDGRLINFSGNNSDGLYIYGAQLEQKSFSTSYIPTSGASATRNQELCNNATPVINSEEGVLYAEISALANDGTLRMVNINDGTQNNRVGIQYSSTTNLITAAYDISGAGQATLNYTLSDANSFNKIAFKFALNDFSLFVNGVKVATDTSGNVLSPNTLNNIDFDYGDNRFHFFGNTKGLKVYPKALADVQLEDLTTI